MRSELEIPRIYPWGTVKLHYPRGSGFVSIRVSGRNGDAATSQTVIRAYRYR